MFKRIAICLLLVLAFVAACSPKTVEKIVYVEREPEKVVIEYYAELNTAMPSYDTIPSVEEPGDWGRYVEQLYEKRCPWVDIVPTLEVHSGGGTEQLSTRILAGRAPIVYSGYVGRFFDYSKLLIGLPTPSVPFRDGTLDICTVNGRLVGYPVEMFPFANYGNLSLMKAAGCTIPEGSQWTTDEAFDCAKKAWEYNGSVLYQYFTMEQSGQHHYWQMMAGGASLFAPGDCSRTTFGDTDYAVRYLEWMYSLLPYLTDNPVNYDGEAPYEDWIAGRGLVGPWGTRWLQPEVDEGRLAEMPEIKILQFPHLPDVEVTRWTVGGSYAIGIFASAVEGDDKLKEEAIKFVEWLTGPEVGYAYYEGTRSARYDGFKGKSSQAIWDEVDTYGASNNGAQCGKYNQARTIWAEETQAFWLGLQTAQETVDNFVSRYDELLADSQ